MALLDIDTRPSPRTVRLFAAVWFPLLVVFVGFQLRRHGVPAEVSWAVWLAGGSLALISVASYRVGRALFVGLSYATYPVGFVVSYALLALIYYAVITPIGLAARVFGYDPMRRRRDAGASSYWSRRPPPVTMDRYFKPY